MAHNARIRRDEAWSVGPVVTSAEWLTLDTNLTAAISGDAGGTWAPTANLVIGGAGIQLWSGVFLINSSSTNVSSSNAQNARILHSADDHIGLFAGHTGQSRTIVTRFDGATYASGWDVSVSAITVTSTATGANAVQSLRVHNRAVFVSATFAFVVASSHGPPAILPKFRVYAVDASGNKTPLLTNANSGYASFTPTPTTGAAWYAAGAVQTFVYTCDAGVVVDTSKYTYWAEVIEEDGASAAAGNVYCHVACAFNTILDLSPQ